LTYLTNKNDYEFGALIVQDILSGEYFLDNFTTGESKLGVTIPNTPSSYLFIRKGRVHTHPSGFPFSTDDLFYFSGQNFKVGEFSVVLTTNYVFVVMKTELELSDGYFEDIDNIDRKLNILVKNKKDVKQYINALESIINKSNSGFKFFYYMECTPIS
jgi:uncharacterized protein YaiE (UPF0345 family)